MYDLGGIRSDTRKQFGLTDTGLVDGRRERLAGPAHLIHIELVRILGDKGGIDIRRHSLHPGGVLVLDLYSVRLLAVADGQAIAIHHPERFHQQRLALRACRATQGKRVAFLDTANHLTREGVGNGGNYHSDGIGAPIYQTPRHSAGNVSIFLSDAVNEFGGLLVHHRAVMQRPRNGGVRNTRLTRYVLN